MTHFIPFVVAYMEIGVTNISAMIGPYVAPLATATEKVGIPYFVTTPVEHKCYRPFNMITVSPDALDMLQVATQVVSRYNWSNIVIIYDSDEGKWDHIYNSKVSFRELPFIVYLYGYLNSIAYDMVFIIHTIYILSMSFSLRRVYPSDLGNADS